MTFVRVMPHDRALVEQLCSLTEAARVVDDPDSRPNLPELTAGWLEVGWDMEPPETYLYCPEGVGDPVGWIELTVPQRDNRHLVVAGVLVHPALRRRGHGSAMLEEVLRRVEQVHRSTVWMGAPADDPGPQAFLRRFGFVPGTQDARRRQVRSALDHREIDRLYAAARDAAAGYDLQRLVPPLSDEVLAELVEVTAAINDAPMGDLTYEAEKFDLARVRDIETALLRRGNRAYRVVARHRATGEAAGHTWVALHPAQPTLAEQGDTAVARHHRGHRLGLLVKLEMMRWLAEVEPQIEVVETWNNADNRFMIQVNESIGYRLSRLYTMYELNLPRQVEAVTAAPRAGSAAR